MFTHYIMYIYIYIYTRCNVYTRRIYLTWYRMIYASSQGYMYLWYMYMYKVIYFDINRLCWKSTHKIGVHWSLIFLYRSGVHWENYISISFYIEWDMIVVIVFLTILNQMEFHLIQNRKETFPHDQIPFNLKGNRNIMFSVWSL